MNRLNRMYYSLGAVGVLTKEVSHFGRYYVWKHMFLLLGFNLLFARTKRHLMYNGSMNKINNKKRILVEDCHKLKLAHFPRGFHYKSHGNGDFSIYHNYGKLPVSYEIVQNRINPYIKICFKRNGKYRWQNIYYEISQINWGIRPYLLCNCGHLANKLFLPPGGDIFKCAQCWDLTYLTQTINRRITGAEFFYRHSRLTKLNEALKGLKRVQYAGKPTARVKSITRMAFKWAPDKAIMEQMQSQLTSICTK